VAGGARGGPLRPRNVYALLRSGDLVAAPMEPAWALIAWPAAISPLTERSLGLLERPEEPPRTPPR